MATKAAVPIQFATTNLNVSVCRFELIHFTPQMHSSLWGATRHSQEKIAIAAASDWQCKRI